MRFISPKTDFAFKKIFGSNQSKGILISFLNAIIYSGDPVIHDLEIIDPYNAAESVGSKDSYLDVRAILQDGTTVIIEMQVWQVEAFRQRIVYNLCKTYGNQLAKGAKYTRLSPVIALTITDFNLFPTTEDVINYFHFQEVTKHISYLEDELRLVFVELPKFTKTLEELETITDKWIYFIKEAPSLEVIPEKMREVPQLKQALGIANQAGLSAEELEKIHRQEMFWEDKKSGLRFAEKEGEERGIQRGIQEGRQEGIILGERRFLVRQLERRLGKLSSEAFTAIESLDSASLESLGEAMVDFKSSEDLLTWLRENFG
ncbi:MAG: Rpn family recombination-promoting nuclease/putative transposase [Spirulinaceae cyanobacterium]